MNTTHGKTLHTKGTLASSLALCVLGCGHRDTLVGTWHGAAPMNNGGAAAAVTYEFGADSLEQFSSIIPPHPPAKTPSLTSAILEDVAKVHSSGKYTTKGDVLTIIGSQLTLTNSHGQPSQAESMITPDSTPLTYRYSVHGDTLTLDSLDGTPPTVLTRLKT